jgi:phosphinothricin acetyltransferase
LEIRNATAADAPAIVAIYNHYILNTTISFEEEAVTAPIMAARIAEVQAAGLPWLVALMNGELVAYAYATKWRVRPAYRFSVESSVYVASNRARTGLGKALYRVLLERLRTAGVHLVIGGIALPNDASVALHEAMGYVKAAHFSEVGRKFDRWVDVGYWQRKLTA